MNDAGGGCCKGPSSSAHQTLDEVDFERGLWGAARKIFLIYRY